MTLALTTDDHRPATPIDTANAGVFDPQVFDVDETFDEDTRLRSLVLTTTPHP